MLKQATALLYIPFETKTNYSKCRKEFHNFGIRAEHSDSYKIYFSAAIQKKSLDNADEIDFDNRT